MYPVASTGGYRLPGSVDGVNVSLLLDMGAAVTLLWEDMCLRVVAENAQAMVDSETVQVVHL